MANMGYVRFENTLRDLRDCAEHLVDELSAEEAQARDRLVKLCGEIAQQFDDDDRTTTSEQAAVIAEASVLIDKFRAECQSQMELIQQQNLALDRYDGLVGQVAQKVEQLQAENAALREKIGAAVEAVQAVQP